MSEVIAHRVLLTLLSVITAFCLPSFLLASLDKLEAQSLIYVFVNIGFFWKIHFGIVRYEKEVELREFERSGWTLLSYSLLRFY
ncbi:hypothetical protein [Flavobacterium sp. W21_SRS_FM6]|uniref:hypothetical protein n=1 Tax=Flavobacterium sp. W21_SRS_FM6 TaxID=3240268 RepID=UPI003F8FC20A